MMGQQKDFSLGTKLIEDGIINTQILKDALEYQELHNTDLKTALRNIDEVNDEQIAKFLGETHQVPYCSLDEIDIQQEALDLIPADLAERNEICPMTVEEDTLTVAISDPLDFWKIDSLEFESGMDVDVVVVPEEEIQEAIKSHYGDDLTNLGEKEKPQEAEGAHFEDVELSDSIEQTVEEGEDSIQPQQQDQFPDLEQVKEDAQKTPTINMVNSILVEAIDREASDVHFDPIDEGVVVRFRIHGELYDIKTFPRSFHASCISRVKVMSELDIAERNIPQDGRFRLNYQGREIDFRVSTVPTTLGEKLVIRILDQENVDLSLNSLGMREQDLTQFRQVLSSRSGIVLVTGPTGSGKTTTLYSALHELNQRSSNIMTLEDPVEFQLEGINQSNVQRKRGYDFASGLKSFLRQDPDIIMIGEIRDYETANIAIQAAQTGHLLLSTLHTNSASKTINRLVDIGVKPYLLADTIQAIVAQRLVRTICDNCREPQHLDTSILETFDFPSHVEGKELTFYEGQGCDRCDYTGYDGRTGLFEVMKVTDTIQEAVREKASSDSLEQLAYDAGMISLRKHAIQKVRSGITSLEEILPYVDSIERSHG